jgi:chemotaxis protein methyltransferase CheR
MKTVIHRFHRSLTADSWLIVSPTETSQSRFSEFASVSIAGATLYKKGAAPPQMVITALSSAQDEGREGLQPAVQAAHSQAFLRAPEPKISIALPDNEPDPGIAELPLASYEQALELYQRGCYDDAAQIAIALTPDDANDVQAMLLLARVYANQGELTSALVWCEKAIASDKLNAFGHYLRATILQEQGLPEEAVRSLRRAVYVDPRFTLGHFALGSLALRQGELKESDKHFENVLLLLASYGPEETVPESEGLSARRLREIVSLQRTQEVACKPLGPTLRTHAGRDRSHEL